MPLKLSGTSWIASIRLFVVCKTSSVLEISKLWKLEFSGLIQILF